MDNPQYLLETAAKSHWEKIGIKSHHGINTPLFSIYSKNSCGIGEFFDLKILIDWLTTIGFDVIQLLPLNALGNGTSPYNAISANALDPIYLSLHALPNLPSELKKEVEGLQNLSSSPRINYEEVRTKKDHILRKYYELEKNNLKDEYALYKEHNTWLEPYAQFVALKQKFHWEDFRKWPTPIELENLQDEVDYQIFLQFLAFKQLSELKNYAEEKKVWLKGDIPILLSPDSADVWDNPEVFSLELVAGAPPDMYCQEGQHWGFPLFNYDTLKSTDFKFWKDRLHYANHFYHLYRVDHIVGFFRIWAIPLGKKAIEGHFIPYDQNEWVPQGEMMLTMMLEAAPMLPLGEDLGTIPKETRQTMHRLGVCSTKVMRWERNWEVDRSFIPFSEYLPDSMTTVSVHDSEPLKLWWKKFPEDAKDFAKFKNWEYDENLSFEKHKDILKDSHHTTSLFHINLLQEYLSLFPELSYENLEEDRINIPGTISPLNWTYRYKKPLEDIISHPALNETMKSLIQ